MTDEQLAKAERLRDRDGFTQRDLRQGLHRERAGRRRHRPTS